ncbi:1-acyl-sn-glycerol-3-phosphate acyltransferase [Microbulbifer sp. PSTR4-B]|uniref:1-acyl-sn-glycerol-3-phosphate acyltransferase n=1 Tax=Microbulbifer sp. PSTR4-B TaxID=3243396 RepID=UPI0040393A50
MGIRTTFNKGLYNKIPISKTGFSRTKTMNEIPYLKAYDTNRFIVPWLSIPLTILYAPIGISLAFIRALLILFMLFIIPRIFSHYKRKVPSKYFKILFRICGFIFISRGNKLLKKFKSGIIICNHISLLDSLFFVERGVGVVATHLKDKRVNKVFSLSKELYPSILEVTGNGIDKNIINYLSENKNNKVVIFPEGTIGNVRTVHKFQKYPFRIAGEVLPVSINIKWSFFINPHPLGANHNINMLWFLFIPFVVFEYRILNSTKKKDGEPVSEYSARIRDLIAENIGALGVQNTFKHRAQLEDI